MASLAQSRSVLKGQLRSGKAAILSQRDVGAIADLCQAVGCRDRFWTPVQVFWTFLWQVLHVDSSCREAVAEALAQRAAVGEPLASDDPTAYCQARKRLPEEALLRSLRQVGHRLREEVAAAITWCGRRVRLVDGTTCSMPDTPDLQNAFGQPSGQAPGCGFPVARVVAMFCWASGAVLEAVIGALATSELALWRTLWPTLSAGEIVLGDRLYGNFYDFVGVTRRGCDAIFRLRSKRSAGPGRRLGNGDHLETWNRPAWSARPRGMERAEWEDLPATLTVRLIHFAVNIPGFRTRAISVATTLLDPKTYGTPEIMALYRDRWLIEMRFRDIKTTMGMDVLRGKSANVVRKEIHMHLLAYNLIRSLMWQAASQHGKPLHRLSLAGAVDRLNAISPYLCVYEATTHAQRLYHLLLKWIANDTLPNRPNRIEPRAVKRRPKEYDLLNRPRHEMRKALLCQ